MSRLGVNKDYLKKRNRGLVLQLIATERCSSRIELSRQTGLTKTGISAIVNELLEKGYLTETEKAKGRKYEGPGQEPCKSGNCSGFSQIRRRRYGPGICGSRSLRYAAEAV